MPAQFLRKTANVSDLRFDLRNPRLIRDATNQEEALKALALLEGPSCVELLKDIIREDGLSPLDNIGIVEENSESIVLEGNRRLLALLLLGRNEDAIEALPKNKHKTVRQLLEKAPTIKSVEVVVFANRQEAQTWITKKHARGQGGAGVIPWKAFQQDRDSYTRNPEKCPKALAFIYAAEELSDQYPELADYIPKIHADSYSTLGRVVKSTNLKKVTGIEIQGTELTTFRGHAYLVGVILDICRALSSPHDNSRTLHSSNDIKLFLEGIHEKNTLKETQEEANLVANIPNHPQEEPVSPPTELVESSPREPIPDFPPIPLTPRQSKTKKALAGIDVTHLGEKINALVKEAQTLQITKYPETLATLFRVILDLTTEVYKDKHPVNFSSKTLVDRTLIVLENIDPTNATVPNKVQHASQVQIVYAQLKESSPRLLQIGPHVYKAISQPEYVEKLTLLNRPRFSS